MSQPILEAIDVAFSYGATTVLDGVSFAIQPGEFVALAGGNGSGKSTLLRVLLGLLHADRGETHVRTTVGYVPQRPMIQGDLPATVSEVVAAGRIAGRPLRRLRAADHAAIAAAIADVDLTSHATRRFSDLSGGQQQRALIAKAIVNDPALLILDEPIAGVDTEAQGRFRDALMSRVARGHAVLLVSHELSAVAHDLHRVVVLGNTKIRFDGPPADLEKSGVSLGVHRHDLPAWLEDQH